MRSRRLLLHVFSSFFAFVLTCSACGVCASSNVLVDWVSRQAILEDRADERVPIGVVNRLIVLDTLLTVLEEKSLELNVPILVRKTHAAPLNVKAGDILRYDELLAAYAVSGLEDAGCEVKEALFADDESFLAALTRTIEESAVLGVSFVKESDEIFPVPRLSPKETAFVVGRFLTRHPELIAWWSEDEVKVGERVLPNQQRILRSNRTVRGLAVGVTSQRWNGVALLENPLPDGTVRKLLSVSLEHNTQKSLVSTLGESLLAGLRQFETVLLYHTGDEVSTMHVYGGERSNLSITVAEDVYVTLSREELLGAGLASLSLRFLHPTPILAPIQKGETIGTLTLGLNGENFRTVTVVARETIAEGSFWQRMRDYVQWAILKQDGLRDEE